MPQMLLHSSVELVQNDMPPVIAVRSQIEEALVLEEPLGPLPPYKSSAIATSLRSLLNKFDTQDMDVLSRTDWTELYALHQVLQAEPGKAASIAVHFTRPDLVLNLRDTINSQHKARETHDAQWALYSAAVAQWKKPMFQGKSNRLIASLETMPVPDVDLWHHVVLTHDLNDQSQSEAALWCLGQPECDRASVAAYFARVAAADYIRVAFKRGDDAFLIGLAEVIGRWNDGFYRHQELALDPPDSALSAKSLFTASLDRLADETQAERMKNPRGLFTEYHGRAALPRDNWCLKTGLPETEPKPNQYNLLDVFAA